MPLGLLTADDVSVITAGQTNNDNGTKWCDARIITQSMHMSTDIHFHKYVWKHMYVYEFGRHESTIQVYVFQHATAFLDPKLDTSRFPFDIPHDLNHISQVFALI